MVALEREFNKFKTEFNKTLSILRRIYGRGITENNDSKR